MLRMRSSESSDGRKKKPVEQPTSSMEKKESLKAVTEAVIAEEETKKADAAKQKDWLTSNTGESQKYRR